MKKINYPWLVIYFLIALAAINVVKLRNLDHQPSGAEVCSHLIPIFMIVLVIFGTRLPYWLALRRHNKERKEKRN